MNVQDMFALAGQHNITCVVESFPFDQVNVALDKV